MRCNLAKCLDRHFIPTELDPESKASVRAEHLQVPGGHTVAVLIVVAARRQSRSPEHSMKATELEAAAEYLTSAASRKRLIPEMEALAFE